MTFDNGPYIYIYIERERVIICICIYTYILFIFIFIFFNVYIHIQRYVISGAKGLAIMSGNAIIIPGEKGQEDELIRSNLLN